MAKPTKWFKILTDDLEKFIKDQALDLYGPELIEANKAILERNEKIIDLCEQLMELAAMNLDLVSKNAQLYNLVEQLQPDGMVDSTIH